MLPFLKNKANQGTGIVTKIERKPDEGSLEDCAIKMIDAINMNDSKALAEAIRAAFTRLDAEPHAEGPHTNEE